MFFVFSTTRPEKKFLQASAVNEPLQSLLRNKSHSCLFSLRIQYYNSFSTCAKYSESVSISISSYLSVSQTFVKKLQKSSNILNLAYCRMKKPAMIGSLLFDFRFDELYLVLLIVDIPQPLEQFNVDRCK